jgi:hypothetical protein
VQVFSRDIVLFDATDAKFRLLVTADHERQEKLWPSRLGCVKKEPKLYASAAKSAPEAENPKIQGQFLFLRKTFPFTRSHLLM